MGCSIVNIYSFHDMSHLQYYAYKGVGERNRVTYSYSQVVRIGDRIECSGQGEHEPVSTT